MGEILCCLQNNVIADDQIRDQIDNKKDPHIDIL